jgi:hypothetical protein
MLQIQTFLTSEFSVWQQYHFACYTEITEEFERKFPNSGPTDKSVSAKYKNAGKNEHMDISVSQLYYNQ